MKVNSLANINQFNDFPEDLKKVIARYQPMIEEIGVELNNFGITKDSGKTLMLYSPGLTIYFGGAEVEKLKEKARKYDHLKTLLGLTGDI